MRIGIVYGRRSSNFRPNGFDIDRLYESMGLTGSESAYFNLVRGLSELGHEVHAYCSTSSQGPHAALSGAHAHNLLAEPLRRDLDAYITFNEPDELSAIRGVPRICAQQLNDFGYCQSNWLSHCDLIVTPSATHRDYLARTGGLPFERFEVIGNSINLEFTEPDHKVPRRPLSIAWCSSPDRGLHRLLEIFPYIRDQHPGANLRIYYRILPWIQEASGQNSPIGRRARYIREFFRRNGVEGENGVYLVDAVPNKLMARELLRTMVLAYPCDPVKFTEGFGVSVLDACAAGCIPIVSDADAFAELYSAHAVMIPGPPKFAQESWIGCISQFIQEEAKTYRQNLRLFASQYSRDKISRQWEALLLEKTGLGPKRETHPVIRLEPLIGIDEAPEPLTVVQAISAIRLIWRELLVHDEVLNARKLLDSVPWKIRAHPEITHMRAKTDRMLAHFRSTETYRELYKNYLLAAPTYPLDQEITGPEALPRYLAVTNTVDATLRIQERADVLDLGCGDGWVTNRLARKQNVRAFGVDWSKSAVSLAKKQADEHKTGALFAEALADIDMGWLPKDWPTKYDVVACLELYEHVQEPLDLLSTLFWLLKPGGKLVLSTPRGSWCQGQQVPYHERWNLEAPREHVRAPVPADLEAELAEVGFCHIRHEVHEIGQDIAGQATLIIWATRP